MRALTKYTAAPIDSVASSALARKIRLVIEPRTRIASESIILACGSSLPRRWQCPRTVPARRRAGVTDRQAHTIALPAGKTLSIEVTIGTVRIEGSDRSDAEIIVERHAPTAAQLARLPLVIDDTPARVIVRALQTENTTDPAIKADVTVRLPRSRGDRSRAGARRPHRDRRCQRPHQRRHPPRTDRRQGSVRHAAARIRDWFGHADRARLSANGLLRLRAFNGDVRLSLAERPVDARILALALNGRDQVGHPADDPRYVGAEMGRSDARQGRAGDLDRRRHRNDRDQESVI